VYPTVFQSKRKGKKEHYAINDPVPYKERGGELVKKTSILLLRDRERKKRIST